MSKTATKRTKTNKPKMTIAERMLAQDSSLGAGKTGYKLADEHLDALVEEMRFGRVKVGEPVDLGNGKVGRLVDKFAEKDSTSTGMKVRRFEVVISDKVAESLEKKLAG
jgi:hypothetical protein